MPNPAQPAGFTLDAEALAPGQFPGVLGRDYVPEDDAPSAPLKKSLDDDAIDDAHDVESVPGDV